MKKILSLAFIGAAILALAACSDDTETKIIDAPVVTLSPTSVTLSAEAVESYTINYTVSNPGDGASVSAAADADWISDISTAVSGQVRFAVAENDSEDMRTATLTLTYSYDDGSVTAKAAIVQYGAGEPVLNVDPNAIVASFAGGEYSFGYTVDNPIDGEEIECSTDAEWITDFDYSVWGTVTFTVAANLEEELRSASIYVTYAGLTKEVDVVQDRVGNPSFRVETTSILANGAGGEYSFDYTLKDAIEGLSVECEADVEWITNFVDDGEGTVTFTVAANGLDEMRSATITATYYGIEREVAVAQKKAPDTGTWSVYGTGNYRYTGAVYSGSASGLKIYQNSDNENRFKIEGWCDDSDLLFTWDQTTNVITLDEYQETGLTYSSYGDVYVKDMIDEFPEITANDCPAGYYEDGEFRLAVYYYCSAGYFGFGYETFTLSDASASKPTLSDVVGTYSINGLSGYDGAFYTSTYVLEESNNESEGNIMFTTIDDVQCGTSSSSGGSGGGPGGGGSTVTTSYVYGTYDEDTGIAEFECDQIYGSITSGSGPFQSTYYLAFSLYSYYDYYPVTFLFFSDGALWGPFYGDMVCEDEYTYSSQSGFSYSTTYEAYMYMYGAQATSSSPSSVRGHSVSTVNKLSKGASLSGSLAAPHLNFTPVKLNK